MVNKEVKEGWRFAADVARKTDETAGSEDRKHTSGGVFVAVDSNLGAVVGEGRLVRSQVMKAESPKLGSVRLFGVLLPLRRLDSEE